MDRIRIDKWLWTIRQFKTRTLATEACEKGRILINDQEVKPSRLVKEGDEVSIKRTGLTRKLKIIQLSTNRLSAKIVSEYVTDLTPQSEIEAYKTRLTRITIYREPGTGRPTKRDRRTLDDFFNDTDE